MLKSPSSLALLLVLLAAGCNQTPVPPAAVTGRVFYHGLPVAGAHLVFVPDEDTGTSGPMALAETRSDGSYVLQTDNAAGAPPGSYRVTIMAMEEVPAYPGRAGSGYPRSRLPEKYRDPELSGLSCKITAGMNNAIDFHLD